MSTICSRFRRVMRDSKDGSYFEDGCLGAKELTNCTCGGNYGNCDFYKDHRKETKNKDISVQNRIDAVINKLLSLHLPGSIGDIIDELEDIKETIKRM